MAAVSHLKSLLQLPEFLLLSGMAGKTSLHCSNYSFPKPLFRKQGCYFCKNLKGNTCLRQRTRMEHFSTNKRWTFGSWELTGVCNVLQQRGYFIGSTNSQLSKESKKRACWECIFSCRDCSKRLLQRRSSSCFVQMESSMFPKNVFPLLLFLSLVPALAKLFSHNFFSSSCCTQPSQLQPTSFCLYFTEISLASSVETNGFSLCFLYSTGLWYDGKLWCNLTCPSGRSVLLITIIRNARLQPPGFTAFPISHQEMTQGYTFLHRSSIAFPKDTKLGVLKELCFIRFPYTDTKMRHFHYRAVLLFQR